MEFTFFDATGEVTKKQVYRVPEPGTATETHDGNIRIFGVNAKWPRVHTALQGSAG